jgi:hypothetical protein
VSVAVKAGTVQFSLLAVYPMKSIWSAPPAGKK